MNKKRALRFCQMLIKEGPDHAVSVVRILLTSVFSVDQKKDQSSELEFFL